MKRYKSMRRGCEQYREKLLTFLNHDDHICWLEKTDNSSYALCAIPKALNSAAVRGFMVCVSALCPDLWNNVGGRQFQPL